MSLMCLKTVFDNGFFRINSKAIRTFAVKVHHNMPPISVKGREMPASPIRKLTPYADKAKAEGKQVYHLNIGQPDIETPQGMLDAVRNIDFKVWAYRSEEHTSELQSLIRMSYAAFCLQKKKKITQKK